VVSSEMAEELGGTPLARVVSSAVAGVDPSCMGLGPVPASRKARLGDESVMAGAEKEGVVVRHERVRSVGATAAFGPCLLARTVVSRALEAVRFGRPRQCQCHSCLSEAYARCGRGILPRAAVWPIDEGRQTDGHAAFRAADVSGSRNTGSPVCT
jgi:hypothetical protein